MPDDVTKLIELRIARFKALCENDYFTVNATRLQIINAEQKYHARLDRERAAEWEKAGLGVPHP